MRTGKSFFAIAIAMFTFSLFTFSLSAATITWIGGSGNWVDAANWDTGTVPTDSDEAIIPTGTVYINNGDLAEATNVEVASPARMAIYNGGELSLGSVADVPALNNLGKVYVYGKLTIYKVLHYSVSVFGIFTDNYFYVASSGEVNVSGIEGVGIRNWTSGYFYNRGSIDVSGVTSSGFSNSDRLRNKGTITIESNMDYPNYGLGNFDNFINYSTGVVEIEGGGYAGITNGSATAVLRNYGEISTNNSAQMGISNSNVFTNYSDAEVNIDNSTLHGFYNNGTLNNSGLFYLIGNQTSGIFNYGTIDNNNFMNMASNGYGIDNRAGGVINNTKTFFINYNNNSIYNEGTITNHTSGYYFVFETIANNNTITNDGFWVSTFNGNHSFFVGSSFTNNGIIEDHYDAFPSSLNNQQVVVRRIAGPMQNGVIYADPIEVVSTSNVTINDWKNTSSSPYLSAGFYDEPNNEFTPNTNAIGLDIIYISMNINASGIGRNVSLNMDNPVDPFTKGGNNSAYFSENGERNNGMFSPKEMTIFPNPSIGEVTLKADFFENEMTEIKVFNSLGQQVMSQVVEAGNFDSTLIFPSGWSNGVYRIHASQNGKSTAIQTVQLQR